MGAWWHGSLDGEGWTTFHTRQIVLTGRLARLGLEMRHQPVRTLATPTPCVAPEFVSDCSGVVLTQR